MLQQTPTNSLATARFDDVQRDAWTDTWLRTARPSRTRRANYALFLINRDEACAQFAQLPNEHSNGLGILRHPRSNRRPSAREMSIHQWSFDLSIDLRICAHLNWPIETWQYRAIHRACRC